MIPVRASSVRSTIALRPALRRDDTVAFVGAVLLPLAIFVALGVAVAGEGAQGWEAPILDLTERYYEGSGSYRLESALELGPPLAAAILLGTVILLLTRRRVREALFCVLAVGGVLALDVPLKEMFRRPLWVPPSLGERRILLSERPRHGVSCPRRRPDHGFDRALGQGNPHPRSPARTGSRRRPGLRMVALPSDVIAGWCLAVSWVAALCLAIRPKARAQSVKSGDSASRSPYSTRGA